MPPRATFLVGVLALAGLLTACNDVTSPGAGAARSVAALPHFSGGSTDSSALGGGGGAAGGGGGGGSTATACGILSSTIQTYNIVVYTTRVGIGFSGTVTNCGAHNAAFEVDVVDVNPDPLCRVAVPHFIAPKNTAPGDVTYWSANSTLVNCMGTTHSFVLYLRDTKTGQQLATTTASAFL